MLDRTDPEGAIADTAKRCSNCTMGRPFEELIAYASRGTQVQAGDVLDSGTCGRASVRAARPRIRKRPA